ERFAARRLVAAVFAEEEQIAFRRRSGPLLRETHAGHRRGEEKERERSESSGHGSPPCVSAAADSAGGRRSVCGVRRIHGCIGPLPTAVALSRPAAVEYNSRHGNSALRRR